MTRSVEILDKDGQRQTMEAGHIVIAMGTRPSLIPGVTADGQKVLTYRERFCKRSSRHRRSSSAELWVE